MLDDGTLERYIDELSVTGLTSNPTIFDQAISAGDAYDDADRRAAASGARATRTLFFELAIEDLRRAADLFAPDHERTDGVDGWVSLEVSPLLAYDAEARSSRHATLHARAGRANLLHQDPGHARQGLPRDRGGDLRRDPGERHAAVLGASSTSPRPRPTCAASSGGSPRASIPPSGRSRRVFISRWDSAVMDRCPTSFATGSASRSPSRTYRAYRELLDSDRWQRLANEGARPQRLLWASTGTKDPEASDVLYVARARRAVHGEHDAGEDAARVRRARRGRPAPARRRRRRGGASLTPFADAGSGRRTRSPPSSSPTAPRRSSPRGRSCWRHRIQDRRTATGELISRCRDAPREPPGGARAPPRRDRRSPPARAVRRRPASAASG